MARSCEGDRFFPVYSPKTGAEVAQSPDATEDMVQEAMASARAALEPWIELGEEGRRSVVRSMAQALEDNIEDVIALSILEKGTERAGGEAQFAPYFARQIAETAIPVDILEDTEERIVRVVRKPVGVVAAISPWNAPILIGTEKVLTALIVGNTVVAKPSPFTPLATLKIGEIWRDVAPPGVVNILAGGDQLGQWMVNHPTTDMISFTGSIAAGRQIASAAGAQLKNVNLELGGNDAAIVLPDVDVDAVANRIFGLAFLGGGQVCAAVKRLYVHESIFDQMVAALAKLASAAVAAPVEDGGNFVPVSTRPQYERVRMLIADAIEHGAIVEAGGLAEARPDNFLAPTILTGVAPGVKVVDEEQFGPVLPIMSFSDVDGAIAQANATEYGLCGSVWTSDITAGEALANRLVCGTTWVNNHAEVAPHIPFGGVKQSGIGRSGGQQGIDAFAELQTQYVYKSPERVTPT
jgi:acyl-CoA reductase-like NAD-dependent aldehyde dehydrogenase